MGPGVCWQQVVVALFSLFIEDKGIIRRNPQVQPQPWGRWQSAVGYCFWMWAPHSNRQQRGRGAQHTTPQTPECNHAFVLCVLLFVTY